jgi:hypothetical protein
VARPPEGCIDGEPASSTAREKEGAHRTPEQLANACLCRPANTPGPPPLRGGWYAQLPRSIGDKLHSERVGDDKVSELPRAPWEPAFRVHRGVESQLGKLPV